MQGITSRKMYILLNEHNRTAYQIACLKESISFIIQFLIFRWTKNWTELVDLGKYATIICSGCAMHHCHPQATKRYSENTLYDFLNRRTTQTLSKLYNELALLRLNTVEMFTLYPASG